MNIQPGISVTLMGGLGYIIGKCIETNPKQVAVIWMVAEIARQVFIYLNERWDGGFSKDSIFYFSFALAHISTVHIGLINTLSQCILLSLGLGVLLCLNEDLGNMRIVLNCTFRRTRGF